MPNLIEIAREVSQLEELILSGGGELSPELENYLSEVSKSLQTKVDGYSVVMSKMIALSNYYREMAEKYLKASQSVESFRDRLEANIKAAMTHLGVTEVKGTDIRFKLSPTKGKIIVDDATLLPPSCVKERIEVIPDKVAIREKFEKGEIVKGARFEQTFSLRSYINKGE